MTILFSGLFVGYCYDLDHRLIDDIRVSVITDLSWGQILSFCWSGATEPGFSSATTFAFDGEGPSGVYCHVSRRCVQRGKVMGACYPDQVGGHKPCVPIVEFGYIRMSPFGTGYILP